MAQPHLMLANLTRRTLSQEEHAVLPSCQFWYDAAAEKIWWDQERFLQHVRASCVKKQKRFHWLDSVDARVALDLSDPPFSVRAPTTPSSLAPRPPCKFNHFLSSLAI